MADARPQPESDRPWTIGRLLGWTQEHLQHRGVEEGRLSAELLLAEALGCRRIDLYARFEREPTADQRAAFRQMVRAAAEHRPIAYVIGRKEFYSLGFKVTPDVMIPRPETELLVERALSWCDEHPQPRTDLLDVGTGSGCIAVTIAKRLPSVHVIASDVSEAALAVAAENAERHGVSDRLRCLRADLLDLPADAVPEAGFDLIIANPPYIAEHERDALPQNVREHEPAIALFAGPDGLAAFRRIADDVHRRLRPGGTLILEVGHSQAAEVEKLVVEAAGLTRLGRHRDLGGIERAVQFTLSA